MNEVGSLESQAPGKPPRFPLLTRLAWLPLAALSALVVALYLLPAEIPLGGLPWIPAVNTVATTTGALLVAVLAAVTRLGGNVAAVLPLGAGMLAYGVSNLVANLVLAGGRTDSAIAIANLGYNVAGLCGLLAAARLLRFPQNRLPPRRVILLSIVYGGILVLTAGIAWASLSGHLPPFFVLGVGSTWVRYLVLGTATIEFALSAGLLWVVARRNRSAFLHWYSLGLALLAIGMGGSFAYKHIDSLSGWAVRASVYLGSVYLTVAMVIAVRQSGRWSIPLANLRETWQRYASLVDNSPDAILLHEGGRYVFANPAAASLFGAKEPAELIGRAVMDLVHPDSRDRVRKGIGYHSPLGQSTQLAEVTLLRLDGEPVQAERIATAVEYNGRPAVQVTIRDVRPRKEAQERIEALARFPSENPNPVLRADGEGRLMYANEASAPLLESWGTRVGQLLPGGLAQTVRSALVRGTPEEVDIPGGGQIFLFSFGPVMEAGYVNLYGRNVTGIRRAERELHELNASLEEQVAQRTAEAERRASQMEALAVSLITAEERERQRIGTVLHDDLQQMLASCKMRLSGLEGQHAGSDQGQRTVQQLRQLLDESLQCCRTITQDLSPPALEHGGLLVALEGLVRRMRDRHGLAIALRADNFGLDRRLQGSAGLFVYRAIQELLFNVVKHSGVAEASVELTWADGQLQVVVADTGRGFDVTALKAAPAAQSGFGLMSIEERSRSLGGSLAIDTAPGRGSRVVLTLPLLPSSAREAGVLFPQPGGIGDPADAPIRPARYRLLVVDDHKVMREGLAAALGMQPGIEVVGQAADGVEAIELARALKPDVILIDIRMPRMDGIDATRRIKAEQPAVRLIGLSMYAEEDAFRAMREAGAETLLNKADSVEAVLRAIHRLDATAGAGGGT